MRMEFAFPSTKLRMHSVSDSPSSDRLEWFIDFSIQTHLYATN